MSRDFGGKYGCTIPFRCGYFFHGDGLLIEWCFCVSGTGAIVNWISFNS